MTVNFLFRDYFLKKLSSACIRISPSKRGVTFCTAVVENSRKIKIENAKLISYISNTHFSDLQSYTTKTHKTYSYLRKSWNSTVVIVTRLQNHGSIPGKGKTFFYSEASRPALEPTLSNGQRSIYGAHPASYPIGTGHYFSGVEEGAAQS
jgi:hypothetical protein